MTVLVAGGACVPRNTRKPWTCVDGGCANRATRPLAC